MNKAHFLSHKRCIMLFIWTILSACSSKPPLTLYEEIGGQAKLAEISNRFIQQIGGSDSLMPYFKNTNIDRFHEKFVEHLCEVSDGPCQYSGDNMHHVHTGMNISQAHFTATVELLITAMTEANVAHTTQNKLLARLAPMRSVIIEK